MSLKVNARNDLIGFGYLGGNAFAKGFKTGKIKETVIPACADMPH